MPDWKSYLRQYLRLPGMKGQREDRMATELADHLEDLYCEARSRGASGAEAERYVEERLGDAREAAGDLVRSEPARLRSQMTRWAKQREQDLRRGGASWGRLADLLRELRFTLRGLAKRPMFSGVAVAVLALGIGASAAVFTLIETIVLSPLPFHQADRLVSVSHTAPGLGVQDLGQCAAWHLTYEDEGRAFEDIGMAGSGSVTIDGGSSPEAVRALRATSGVFRALRVRPILGRSFTRADEDPDAPPIVALAYGYWQGRFGGDTGVVGRRLQIDGASAEIVGVLPTSLRALGSDPDVFVPLRFRRATLFVGNTGFDGVARLKDGVTLEQASADVARMLPLASRKFPGGPVEASLSRARLAPRLEPLKRALVGPTAHLLWILMAAVGVLLLIACADVANLFLARAETKQTEMAVRSAMGASSSRIAWEYLRESLLLGLLGGLGGLVLAHAGLRTLVTLAPDRLPRLDEVSLNPIVLLFTLGISLGAGLLFGMFPVLRHRRAGLAGALKQGGRRAVGGRMQSRTRSGLAISQVALALLLLVASGLLLRSYQALGDVKPGFQSPQEVLSLRLSLLPTDTTDPGEAALIHERIARRLAEIPGVSGVGLANDVPMDGFRNWNPFYAEGVTAQNEARANLRHKWIGQGYLETLQIPLLAGRALTWDDAHHRAAVALVSERMALEYWGSPQAALGKGVSIRPTPVRWHHVVGVVADVHEEGLDQPPPLTVYWPQVTLALWEGTTERDVHAWTAMSYAIRSERIGTLGFLQDVRRAVSSVNPGLPLRAVAPLSDLMAASVARTSFCLLLLAVSAGVALILGLVGVYGVVSYTVTQRRRDLGLRMALGARAFRVKAMVVRQGLWLSGVGVLLGLGLALGLTRLMTGLLFGVSPGDPLTFSFVALGLTGTAAAASYLPAHRASRVDPAVALREE